MKKLLLLFVCILCFAVFAARGFAWYSSHTGASLDVFQTFCESAFFMYYKWFNADAAIMSEAGSRMSEEVYEFAPYYFQEYDYIPSVSTDILLYDHKQNNYSVPNEGKAYFTVKYNDMYENPPSAGYPKLILTHPDGSTDTYTMSASTRPSVYFKELDLPKGEYSYSYTAKNDYYIIGEYSLSGNWYVTSRPYGFVKISPKETVEELPDATKFSWIIYTDESNDVLSYEFYLGMNGDKTSLEKYQQQPAANANSFLATGLNHKKQYYWYMRIVNKYGAEYETELFPFVTGGMVEKFYNAPNPFNPARGEKTKFVYNMDGAGSAKITLYSEYGDKVWESGETFSVGGTSSEIMYDGRDGSGRTLYNGTYIAILTKKYQGRVKTEKCRILIIK
ncbi:MAG: hypothetical protein LBQ47_00650 [Endomicrobium sp.]|jgi:hypothetical protein|nr:hypothetical protein [Endomicrobium sp.]